MNYINIEGKLVTPKTEEMAYEQTNQRMTTLKQDILHDFAGVRQEITETANEVENRIGNEMEVLNSRLTSDISSVDGRIDNIIAHNNDTEGNSELIDIRTGADGTIYASAGDAVRNQLRNISQVNVGVNKVDPARLSKGRYTRIPSQEIVYVEDADNTCSDYIPITDSYCTAGCQYRGGFDTVKRGYVLFNENFEPIFLSLAYNRAIIEISDTNAKYIRIWWWDQENSAPYFAGFSDSESLLPFSAYSRTVNMPYVSSVNGVSIADMNTEVNRLSALHPDTSSNRVCCWGDSLTYGSGVSNSQYTYPYKLIALLRNNGNTQFPQNYGVLNNGNAGGGVEEIATYQGGIVLNVKPVTIPASGSVNIQLEPFLNTDVQIMKKAGNYITSQNRFDYENIGEKMNHCFIAGVKGDLLRDSEGNFVFTRLQSGAAVTFDRPVPLITYGASELNKPGDIAVIWAGTNNRTMNADEMIGIIRMITDNLTSDKYIIIGLTAKNYHSDIEEKNRKLGIAFGKHFLDIRSYILNYGLQDESLSPTEEDTTAISQGKMPPSLLHDATHFNDYGYDVIANQVYIKGKQLGYWE